MEIAIISQRMFDFQTICSLFLQLLIETNAYL